MSSVDRHNRIKSLFSDALELQPPMRDSFLDGASTDDASIVVEVRNLIAAHERASGFIEDPTIDRVGSPPPGDQTIGRYRLVRLIGEGGFGSVYLAEQLQPIARQVALKIIKPGMDTRQVIARFEAERQALAIMKHPNIATVFDAGVTREGRSYFVMEYVDGVAITDYCEQRRLTIDQRLNLFIDVCNAVQHAHTKGIIHRDIKPSNLLVSVTDTQPQPKVIDFGIAKATSGRPNDLTVSTDGRQFVGTPRYMSPEQAGEDATDVDTRADVYSLGVVLYEMLTGFSPFHEQQSRTPGIGEWRRIICEDQPARPSARLSTGEALADVASREANERRKLATRIRGDLDWIALKALEKDRERRYSSASALAEDLRRHLNHEPVTAGPPTLTYRLRKFIRRNRMAVVAAAIVGLAIIGGGVGITAGMLQARESAAQAMSVNEFMRGVLTSVDPDRDGADVRLIEVLRAASDSAAERFAGHPQLEAQVRDMLGEVYAHLSMWDEAVREEQRAESLWRSAVGPDDARTLQAQLRRVLALLSGRRFEDADPLLADLSRRAKRVLTPDSDLMLQVDRVAAIRIALVRFKEGAQALRAVYDHAQRAGASESVQLSCLSAVVQTLDDDVSDRDADEALVAELETFASELAERASVSLGPSARTTMLARLALARAGHWRGDYATVAATCEQILEETANRFNDCNYIRVTARNILSESLYRIGQKTQAANEALLIIGCSRNIDLIRFGTRAQCTLPFLEQSDQWAEGEALARELCTMLSSMGGHGQALIGAESHVASFVSRQGRLDEADTLFAALVAQRDTIQGWTLARFERQYGEHLLRKGALEKAAQHLMLAAELVGDVRRGTWDEAPDDIICAFIALYESEGNLEKVDEYRRLQAESLAAAPVGPQARRSDEP